MESQSRGIHNSIKRSDKQLDARNDVTRRYYDYYQLMLRWPRHWPTEGCATKQQPTEAMDRGQEGGREERTLREWRRRCAADMVGGRGEAGSEREWWRRLGFGRWGGRRREMEMGVAVLLVQPSHVSPPSPAHPSRSQPRKSHRLTDS